MIKNSKFEVDDETYFLIHYRFNSGYSQKQLAEDFNIHRNTVSKWLASKQAPSQTLKTRRVSAIRKQMINMRRCAVRKLIETKVTLKRVRYTPKKRLPRVKVLIRRPYSSVRSVCRGLYQKHNIRSSPSTVWKDLHCIGKIARKKRKAPPLTAKHRLDRQAFCKEMIRDKLDIKFSDECYVDTNDHGSTWVWISPGEMPDVMERDQGPTSILVWGCIGKNFKHLVVLPPQRLTKDSYRAKVLRPSISALASTPALFQQDGAKPHGGHIQYLHRCGVRTLPKWPAKSCDLSPIENLWEILKSEVSRRAPHGVEELMVFIKEAWDAIPMKVVNSLIDSFEQRCKDCVAAKGNIIKPRKQRKNTRARKS